MPRFHLALLLAFIVGCQQNTSNNIIYSSTFDDIEYFGEDSFLLEGTDIPASLKENMYDRLPVSYKEIVRKPVWELSKNSAGLSIRFLSNSSVISVKWELLNNFSMDHMPDTGIKGVDFVILNRRDMPYVNQFLIKTNTNWVDNQRETWKHIQPSLISDDM